MLIVRFSVRLVVALLLVASVGAAGLAACAGDPSTELAQMACCKAMGKDCPMHTTAEGCCKTERSSHQATAFNATLLSTKIVAGLTSTASAAAAILPSVGLPLHRVAATEPSDGQKPHSQPTYLLHIPLLI